MSYKKTLHTCYRGYVVQAIINNLSPVLFTTFGFLYNIPVGQIALLIVINFCVQIAADLFSVVFLDRIGMRRAGELAHLCAAVGLWMLAFLPIILPSAFLGLVIATAFMAWGGGLLEVLVSPLVDSIPGDAKSAGMSLLHSFYCWGQVAVVLFTTLALRLLGTQLWFIIPLLWSLLPLYNLVCFHRVPIPDAQPTAEHAQGGGLFKQGLFWLGLILMVAAGASEQGMSQWSSSFAEAALGVDKVIGDLLGPCLFGVFMALGRTAHGILGDKLPLRPALLGCAGLAIACYLTASLVPIPMLALAACALCGLAVSLFWPGVFSYSAEHLQGGTRMFGIFAILGDVGCAAGPWLIGFIAGLSGGASQLRTGLLFGSVFPVLMLVGVFLLAFVSVPSKKQI